MFHGNLTIIAFLKPKSLWLIKILPSFDKDSDDEQATEQLTTVVDVTFFHAIIQKYPIIIWTITRCINQRHLEMH